MFPCAFIDILFGRSISGIDLDLSRCLQSLPRLKTDSLQRSDGEDEEDGSLTLSPKGQNLLPDDDLRDWDGLAVPFPVNLKQEGQDGGSVSLGDLVRHMHPYCMTISVENEEGEHILPEGGILFEVVDQGENGEPILVIPDVDLPVSLPCKKQPENGEKPSAAAGASHGSEHIIDDPIHSKAKCTAPLKRASLDPKGEMATRRQEAAVKAKSPTWRKKKKKTKTKPVDGKDVKAQPKKQGRVMEEGIKELPPDSTSPSPVELQKQDSGPSELHTDIATVTLEPKTPEQVQTSASQKLQETPSPDIVACSQPSSESPADQVPVSSTPPPVSPDTPPSPSHPVSPDVSRAPPPVVTALTEPKPKSLSLAEYRRLRQQKQPAAVDKIDGGSSSSSSKWPSLPVLPKELPPILCLPDPSTRDPRRTNPHAARREAEEVKPAWQPRGPCAPPTPEALLAPPAYMVSSTRKVPAVQSQQTPERSKSPSPRSSPQLTPVSAKSGTGPQHVTTVLAGPRGSSDPLQSEKRHKSPSGGESHPAHSEGHQGFHHGPAELQTGPKTTTEGVQSAATPASAPVTSGKSAAQQAAAHTVTDGAPSSRSKSSKVSRTTVAGAARAPDSPTLRAEPAVSENKDKLCTVGKGQRPKTSTQELIEAFTCEIGEFRLGSTF